ncbi:MAG: GNAT family N-acetyltransferase [Anaerolineales bacterium]
MDPPTITTSRLSLRSFTFEDTDSLHQILGVPGVLQYFSNPEPPERDRVEKLIDRQIKHWQDYGYGWWAVVPHAEQQLIGWSGLQYLPETDEIEIGYLLSKPYWGKGLATESAIAGLDFGFSTLGLREIVGIVHPENTASQGVLKKIGMQFVRQAHYFGMDCYQYKINSKE